MRLFEVNMTVVSTICMNLPDCFPAAEYEAIFKAVHTKLASGSPVRFADFMLGWNGLAHRFCALSDYAADYAVAYPRTSTTEGRHRQETALFEFFATALSCLECTSFALYAFGRAVWPNEFPHEEREITPQNLRYCLASASPDASLLRVLLRVLESRRYRTLTRIRNMLAHRGTPGRTIFISTMPGYERPDEWSAPGEIVLRRDLLMRWTKWLAVVLTQLLQSAEPFIQAQT